MSAGVRFPTDILLIPNELHTLGFFFISFFFLSAEKIGK